MFTWIFYQKDFRKYLPLKTKISLLCSAQEEYLSRWIYNKEGERMRVRVCCSLTSALGNPNTGEWWSVRLQGNSAMLTRSAHQYLSVRSRNLSLSFSVCLSFSSFTLFYSGAVWLNAWLKLQTYNDIVNKFANHSWTRNLSSWRPRPNWCNFGIGTRSRLWTTVMVIAPGVSESFYGLFPILVIGKKSKHRNVTGRLVAALSCLEYSAKVS